MEFGLESDKTCVGCGFKIEPMYWVGQEPDFCGRCERTLSRLALRWRGLMDAAAMQQVRFSQNYTTHWNHGIVGHLDYVTIVALAGLLDDPKKVLRG